MIQVQPRLSVICELSNYIFSVREFGGLYLEVYYRTRDWSWLWKLIKWTFMGYYRDLRINL